MAVEKNTARTKDRKLEFTTVEFLREVNTATQSYKKGDICPIPTKSHLHKINVEDLQIAEGKLFDVNDKGLKTPRKIIKIIKN